MNCRARKKTGAREVVRVITPGTTTSLNILEPKEIIIWRRYRGRVGTPVGLAYADVTTGEFLVTEFSGADADEKLRDELHRLNRAKYYCRDKRDCSPAQQTLRAPGKITERAARCAMLLRRELKNGFFARTTPSGCCANSLGGDARRFGLSGHPQAVSAAGAMVHYLRETSAKARKMGHISRRRSTYGPRRYYEQPTLCARHRDGSQPGTCGSHFCRRRGRGTSPTLLSALDETATGMGARLLRQWIFARR